MTSYDLVDHNGEKYIRSGNSWIVAGSYLKAPEVVCRELERRYARPFTVMPKKQPVRKAAPRRQPDRDYHGLTAEDFSRRVEGTSWRRRETLAGLLAGHLSDFTGNHFISYPIYPWNEVHLANGHCYELGRRAKGAKFQVRLSEREATYGFQVEKPDVPLNDQWDWRRFTAVIGDDDELQELVDNAARHHDLKWLVAQSVGGRLIKEIEVLPGDPLIWDGDEIDWQTFTFRLLAVPSSYRCSVRLCGQVGKTDALQDGAAVMDRMLSTFRELMPLYEACVRKR